MYIRQLVQLILGHCEQVTDRRAIYEGMIARFAEPTLLESARGVDPIYDAALERFFAVEDAPVPGSHGTPEAPSGGTPAPAKKQAGPKAA